MWLVFRNSGPKQIIHFRDSRAKFAKKVDPISFQLITLITYMEPTRFITISNISFKIVAKIISVIIKPTLGRLFQLGVILESHLCVVI